MIHPNTKESLLKHLFGLTAFTMPSSVKLCLATAYNSGTNTYTEVSGGSYAAQAINSSNFAVKTNKKEIENTASVQFTAMPAATVTHAFVKDGSGNQLVGAPLVATRVVLSGDHVVFNSGSFNFTLDDVV